MQIYLVGGAVRDKLLGLPVKDRDYVVVGATPEEIEAKGFKAVGRDFPVYLHPDTGEEYALARTERKSGRGYKGFKVEFSKDITLEDDLIRRDLTINALAQSEDGSIIDPFGGQDDIKRKKLRHISPAFAEDPLRVLRVARFAARFHYLGFEVAPDTLALMTELINQGEMEYLTPERVWTETHKALSTPSPQLYFEVLRECGALKVIFPELDCLWGIPNPEKWHPEIDTGVHTMMVLEQAAKKSEQPMVRFAAVLHDLGKGVTPSEQWPQHRGHEESGVPLIKSLCRRIKAPKDYENLAIQVSRFHLHSHKMFELKAKTVYKVLKSIGAYRQGTILEQFIIACEADFNGRLGLEQDPYPQAQLLRQSYEASKNIDAKPLMDKGLEGAKLGQAIERERISRIKETLESIKAAN
ncbi:multifunctional CCA addition/repair protein [Kangiella sediminilitoris]|uniref:Multifunctional CCA protein n=1 Tax=Kangiella sediminilitoris TaxID=1144748 RepID=A0A1B3B8P8_9GAMM|nr:multifunctional CCA addition/repair protein [Kangiella sediminilitoris]AOE49155.1 Multifunctional CCA protein [Kangiella sediminilitoris]